MKILKYTPELQREYSLKTESAPWLHIAIQVDRNKAKHTRRIIVVVFVWDTRDVLETKEINDSSKNTSPMSKSSRAIDSLQPLSGKLDPNADYIDFLFKQKREHTPDSPNERNIKRNERVGKQMSKFMGR